VVVIVSYQRNRELFSVSRLYQYIKIYFLYLGRKVFIIELKINKSYDGFRKENV